MKNQCQQWWEGMKESGAVWEHSGDSRAPHVILRSGKHSDGFVDTLQYLSNVSVLETVAQMLAKRLREKYKTRIDWVFGSPMAGIPLATMTASYLGAPRVGFNEKAGDKDLTCRFDLEPGDSFLLIEEMTTTGATPRRGIEAVMKKNPKAFPLNIVGSFLVRCEDYPAELSNRELVSLISLPKLDVRYHEWDESDCPLCQAGSKPIANCKRVWRSLLRTMREPTFTFLVE